jgi:hypothetical protein
MKNIFINNKHLITVFVSILLFTACQKEVTKNEMQEEIASASNKQGRGHLIQTKTYNADVVVNWLNMQLNMLRVPLAPGTTSQASDRCMAYCGIALYESVVPGMPAYQSLYGYLNAFPKMPSTEPGRAYHWAASANAALAAMNRYLFPNTSAANQTLINNLENILQAQFTGETDAATLQRSIDFGKEVAQAVFNWAQTDGTFSMPSPATYVIPTGPGLWEKTPPNFSGPANPFHHMRRRIVAGSDDGIDLTPLPSYSTDPASPFFAMVKNVYDISLSLTPEQTATAHYHSEASPGYPGGGSMPAMLSSVIQKAACSLDVAALAYAKTGIGSYDALTTTFIKKYTYNTLRPITYIHNVMGQPGWSTIYPTPGYPEFPAGHPTNGGVLTKMLSDVFGENFSFDFNYYAFLGRPDRHYDSFEELGEEMATARVLAGIHYQEAVDAGLFIGKKVSTNILNKVKFKKD